MDFSQRDALACSALRDKDSLMYKTMCDVILGCDAADRRAMQIAPKILIPFPVPEDDLAVLELQFGVQIRLKSGACRIMASRRAAAMIFLLDASLVEHASSLGRSVLQIDGDIVTMAMTGISGRMVERTHGSSRLAAGYFYEDDQLRNFRVSKEGVVNMYADAIATELADGGGEHFWPSVRGDGPRVESITINHFKTVAGPKQLAWLASARGAVVYGAIFFQLDMLTKDRGKLECFPGEFCVDRENDVITLIPAEDPTFSISHTYSDWISIVRNNVIVVNGKEYLCEKYKKIVGAGIIYYTLSPIGSDFEAPESLRTCYFDSAATKVTVVKFPKVAYSAQGVPVGVTRGEARILTNRLELVLSRLSASNEEVVKPVDAFIALMDYNNTVLTSLDNTKVADRMSVDDEADLSVALALHVNWMRHAAKGTFKTLLETIKTRQSMGEASALKFASIALMAWWGRGKIKANRFSSEPDPPKVIDKCGTDFSVVIAEADPWIEIVQEAGVKRYTEGVFRSWLPGFDKQEKKKTLLERARAYIARVKKPKVVESAVVQSVDDGKVEDDTVVQCLDEVEAEVHRPVFDLTVCKKALVSKMVGDQAAVSHFYSPEYIRVRHLPVDGGAPDCPVPEVDPESALNSDVLMANKGVFTRAFHKTGYRMAEVDIDKVTLGTVAINDAKRLIPKSRWVRLPKVDLGVEGKRVPSQASLLGAVFKRNVGVPGNRGFVNLDTIPELAVSKVIQVCFVDGWEGILERELGNGLWTPDIGDISAYVADMDELKTKIVLDQFFNEGHVALDRWLLMAKGKVKPSREPDADMKIDHAQTIMYLEQKGVNGIYSPMMRRFKRVLRMMLRPEVQLNTDMAPDEYEAWYNSLDSHRNSVARTYTYGADISVFDRSQEHVGLAVDLAFYKRLGLDRTRLRLWEEAHGSKKAMAMMFGVVLAMVMGGISGDWKTLQRNGIINLAAILTATDIRRNDLVMIDVKGDDVDLETFKPLRVETAVERLSLTFNFSAKFFTTDVRYMCKTFRIKVCGKWYFVADPWARAQSACTPLWIGNHEDVLEERWQSLCADLRHYDNGIVLDAVAEAAQQHYGLERPLYGMVRALAKFVADKHAYINFFKSPERVD